MFTLKNTATTQIISVLLTSAFVFSSVFPSFVAFAEEVPPEEPPAAQEAPPEEPAPEEPAPEEPAAEEPAAVDGEDGTDGEPQPETPPEDGENGDDATNDEPAENGESGDDASVPEDPPAAPADGQTTVIDTGDAGSSATSTSAGNTTNVTTPPPAPTEYPYGKPPQWAITMCANYDNLPPPTQYWCDKIIVKPDPVNVETQQDIEIGNTGEATSETGENVAEDVDGVYIETGDADAFGYLISLFNIAVTNSTGSILFLKNPLADALDFTQRIMDVFSALGGGGNDCTLSACTLSDAVLNMITGNDATVTNELVVRSGTGVNDAQSDAGSADINTGEANAFGSIVNFGNLTIVDSRYLILLMANEGDLNGNIVLPPADFFMQLSSGAKAGPGDSHVLGNEAEVENNGEALADTGDNGAIASSTAEQASINTGDANADTTVMNFVNELGAPICFIVNVGGEWNGDVVRLPEGFSRETTNYGEIICGAGQGEGGNPSGYTIHSTTTNYAKVLNNAIVEATTGGNTAAGADANIETGDANAFLQILNVLNQTIIGQDWIFSLFTVSGDWNGDLVFGPNPAGPGSDGDILTDIAGQVIASASGSGGVRSASNSGVISSPQLTVIKTVSVVSTSTPAKVDYKIVVKNDKGGGPVYRARLSDVLIEPAKGQKLFTRAWNLGNIKEGEEITLTYTVEYNTGIPYGIYENTATVTGFRNSSIYDISEPMAPVSAVAKVEIRNGEILGIEEGPMCSPLLSGYIIVGKQNSSSDVQSLQTFLNVSEGENLTVNGIYDGPTVGAVKRFQRKYSEHTLAPWGISLPTGNVYYTTQRTINNMYCKGGEFPLTAEQIAEINAYKMKAPSSASQTVGQAQPKRQAFTLPKMVPGIVTIPSLNPSSLINGKKVSGLGQWMKKMMPFVEAGE